MKLSSVIEPELVICGAQAGDYEEARDLLLRRLTSQTNVDSDVLRKALAEREALATTVVAPGIAFPHARTAATDDFHIVIGTFPEGFSVPNEPEPVRLVVMFLMTEGGSSLYLRCVSAMARFLGQQGNLDRLLRITNEKDLRHLFDTVLVKDVVTAQDVMRDKPITCCSDWTLRQVTDLMVKQRIGVVPVVDSANCYQGLVTANRLLRVGLPDYLLSLESVAFLTDSEPFEELLRQERSMTVEEIMDREAPFFMAHTPMIVVASRLVRQNLSSAAVLRDDSREVIGVISALDFVHKVVRA